ncbi:MAG: hypothetical protein NZ823_10645 [Blastocatellia bacterium]|nr:hypothetical protein [Blastocatellia bacterium]
MTPEIKINEQEPIHQVSQAEFQELVSERIRLAVRLMLTVIMNEEAEAFVRRPTARPARLDGITGTATTKRDLVTTVGKIDGLRVPRTQGGFRTQVFEHINGDSMSWTWRLARCSLRT